MIIRSVLMFNHILCVCVSGLLDKFLQQYGSLIPIQMDEVVDKLQTVFNESFSHPHRCHSPTLTHSFLVGSSLHSSDTHARMDESRFISVCDVLFLCETGN